ncbi:hypothetical protein [Herbaspirillum huttiense]|uniref:hypothetical protein n=1 Tax=Herbaspirillum huttiense TaxID=863372 RepID=UPI0039AEEFAC
MNTYLEHSDLVSVTIEASIQAMARQDVIVISTRVPLRRIMVLAEPRESYAVLRGREFTEQSALLFLDRLETALAEHHPQHAIEYLLHQLGMVGWLVVKLFSEGSAISVTEANIRFERGIDGAVSMTHSFPAAAPLRGSLLPRRPALPGAKIIF